jgi:hypothetical protein
MCPLLQAYELPYVNLGLDSFLSGGPVRPKPGWYVEQYLEYYDAHKFVDACGGLLGGVPSPRFKVWVGITELIYEPNWDVLGGKFGFDSYIPYFFSSTVSKNTLDIHDSGRGFGDLGLGMYIQWNPIMFRGRPILQNRLEFFASFPTGKVFGSVNTLNPGNNLFFIDPYWSATLFLADKWTLSWYLFYLICGKNRTTHRKPGHTMHTNYSLAYEPIQNLYIGINGYFLQQLQDTSLCGKKIPSSKERIFGIGPGGLYQFPHDMYLFIHFYVERFARNRTEGVSFITRFEKIF